jgi:hypothetical protein
MSWRRVKNALGFNTEQWNTWVAVHEAGHAVSSLVIGHKVRHIELKRDWGGSIKGGTTMTASTRDPRVMPTFHAGIEAQEIWMQQGQLWTPRRIDVSRAAAGHDLEVIQRFTPDRGEQQAHADAARGHVAGEWGLVQRMATALLERGRLSARDIRRL